MATPSNNVAVVLVDYASVNVYSKKQPIVYLPLTYEDIGVFHNDAKELLYLRFNRLPWNFRTIFSRFRNFENYYTFWSLLNSERSIKWLQTYNRNSILNGNFDKIESPAHFLLSQCLSLDEMKLQLHM
jgi:hypothetical protein